MNRTTLYFRLSLIWLVILAGGVAFFGSVKGASVSHYDGAAPSLDKGSLILNDAPP